MMESDTQSTGMQLKTAAKLSTVIGLITKHEVCRMNAIQSPCKGHGQQWHLHSDPCKSCERELLLHCRRPYSAGMATLRRPHCNCSEFVLNMLKVRAVARRSMRSHSIYWRCHCFAVPMPLLCCADACVHTARIWAFCIFLGRRGNAVRRPLWCDRGFRRLFIQRI